MYHAACKVEFQPFKRSYSQLTFFNLKKKRRRCWNFDFEPRWSRFPASSSKRWRSALLCGQRDVKISWRSRVGCSSLDSELMCVVIMVAGNREERKQICVVYTDKYNTSRLYIHIYRCFVQASRHVYTYV